MAAVPASKSSLEFKKNNLLQLLGTGTTDIYSKLISFGGTLDCLESKHRIPTNRVTGCLSETYIRSTVKSDRVYISGHSDALISKGAAGLVAAIINGSKRKDAISFIESHHDDLPKTLGLSMLRSIGLSSMLSLIRTQLIEFK